MGGNDLIEGGPGADTIDGGTGTDTISFSTSLGGVTVDLRLGIGTGGAQADSAGDTYSAVENITGSEYDDSFTPDTNANVIDGRGGADFVSYIDDTAGLTALLLTGVVSAGGTLAFGDRLIRIEHLAGSDAFADDLTGSFSDNHLLGHGGDDVLEGLAGSDILDGGAGNDTARYDSSNSAVSIDLTTGSASGGHAQGDTLLNIENLIGSYANDTLVGNALANWFDGGDGSDTMSGLGGDDKFRATRGVNHYDGGAGTDRVSFAGSTLDYATLPVIVNLLTGSDNFGSTYTSIETVIGGQGNDILSGNATDNHLEGGGGNDTMSDGDGADTLLGGAGADVFVLDTASGDFQTIGDTLDGGSGSDTLQMGLATGPHLFDMASGTYVRSGLTLLASNFEHFDGATLGNSGSFDIKGTDDPNTLAGGSGDDTLEGRAGADTLAGGTGFDTLSYDSSTSAVTVDLAAGMGSGGDAAGDSFTGFEALRGSASNDVLSGDGGDNILYGGAGADTLIGRGGRDALYGEGGDDLLWLSDDPEDVRGAEVYDGGTGKDALIISAAPANERAFDLSSLTLQSLEDLVFFTDAASAGDLSVRLSFAQVLAMGLENISVLNRVGGEIFTVDFIMGTETYADLGALTGSFGTGAGETVAITGDSDDETVIGSLAANTVTLAGGADHITILGGVDTIDLGTGDDTFEISSPATLSQGAVYEGGAGLDQILIVAASADLRAASLSGIEDLVFSQSPVTNGARHVSLTAEQAIGDLDRIVASTDISTQNVLQIDLPSDTATWDLSPLVLSQWRTSDLVHITQHSLSPTPQTITGTNAADLFDTAGGDSLFGGAGDDRMWHQHGAALSNFDGGAGYDTADYSREMDHGVTINLISGTAARAGSADAVLSSVEAIIGTALNDVITADSADNTLHGGGGDDTLTGGGGQDSVYGEDGDDLLIDKDPANLIDHYDGGAGTDTLQAVFVQWGDGVLFDLMTGAQTLAYGDTLSDTFTAVENLTVSGAAQMRGDNGANVLTAVDGTGTGTLANVIYGEGGNDVIHAGAGHDVLDGGFGNDVLNGEDGDDLLIGGGGNDVLDGGAGVDTASYAAAGGRVAVFLARAPDDLGSGQGIDTFISIENVIGTDFDDRLVGDNSDNRLEGGLGADVLIGLGGDDVLIGGGGADDLTGSGGDDALDGGDGNDALSGLGGADILTGGAGADIIHAGLGVDIVQGGEGDDDIFGDFGADVITGGPGDDNIRADGSGDTVDGGEGNDRIVGGNGQDVLFGGAGNDTLFGGGGSGAGDGLRDVFVFKSAELGGGGFDIIRDFEDTIDKLDFFDTGYTTFADVQADAVQAGAHVEIALDFGGLLRINDFMLSDLTAGDFLF